MTDQKEKLGVSDQMVTQTKPSPEAAAYIEKLDFTMNQVGQMAIAAILPSVDAMLGRLAHCVANKRFAPEYERVMNDLSMWLLLQVRLREMLIDQAAIPKDQLGSIVVAPQIEHGVIPQDAGKPWCEVCGTHHDINTKPAQRVTIGLITDPHDITSVMLSLLESKDHGALGLHMMMSKQEVDMLSKTLGEAASNLKQKKAD